MRQRLIVASVFAAVWLLAACATPSIEAGGPGATRTTAIGEVFVDSQGMTLYTFDEDTPGQSNCTFICAAVWPPVGAEQMDSPPSGFSIIIRDDGSPQWAYQGKPLYVYNIDGEPGDVEGDGVDGVWHAAKP